MNAVARAVGTDNDFISIVPLNINFPELKTLALVFFLLASALGVIYIKDLNRRLFITYHKLQAQSEQLQAHSNKLLLEQSAWGAQARVQLVAQGQLQMQIPSAIDVKMVKV